MELRAKGSLGWKIFQESNDAVLILSCENVIIDVNPFTQQLTSFGRNELINRSFSDLIRGTDGHNVTQAIEALEETGRFHSREQFQLKRKDADPLPVNLSISRIHAENGVFAVAIVRDISERVDAKIRLQEEVKKRTAELRAVNESLANEIAQRRQAQCELEGVNRQLAAAVQQLRSAEQNAIKQERVRIAGQLASGMAHDINNCVAPVMNFAELLSMGDNLSATQREYVAYIKNSTADISAIVRRLREIKPTNSKVVRREVSLPNLLQSVADLTRSRWRDDAQRRGASIQLSVTKEPSLAINVDESALRSVLTNLVLNAVDAITGSGQIELRHEQRGDRVLLSVSDDGEGMTKDQQSHCFEPFITSRPQGCGLGLSLCKRIVEQHRGEVHLSSNAGKGTTVTIELPLVESELHDAIPQLQRKKARFLLVEDNQLVRTSMQMILQTKGMEVDAVGDGQQALQRLKEKEYQVVMSDFGLEEMNGVELLTECRQRCPDIKTILVSGWVDDAHEFDSKSAHITLQKPFDVDELLDKLADLPDEPG